MDVFCGIDWSEGHHDVALVDDTGKLLAKCRINDDLDGYRLLLDLLAEHGDTAEAPIPVAIETSRGLLVATLRQGPRKIYAVNPMVASRYRDRHGVSRKKSDPGHALVLANIIRTDAPVHRPATRYPLTTTWPKPSLSWPAHSRTRSGTGSRSPISCGPCSGSTSRR